MNGKQGDQIQVLYLIKVLKKWKWIHHFSIHHIGRWILLENDEFINSTIIFSSALKCLSCNGEKILDLR